MLAPLLTGDFDMGLLPHEQRQQDEMQKDLKSLVRTASQVETRITLLEERVNNLLGDKKRFIGFVLMLLLASIGGLCSWVWTLITHGSTPPHP